MSSRSASRSAAMTSGSMCVTKRSFRTSGPNDSMKRKRACGHASARSAFDCTWAASAARTCSVLSNPRSTNTSPSIAFLPEARSSVIHSMAALYCS